MRIAALQDWRRPAPSIVSFCLMGKGQRRASREESGEGVEEGDDMMSMMVCDDEFGLFFDDCVLIGIVTNLYQ